MMTHTVGRDLIEYDAARMNAARAGRKADRQYLASVLIGIAEKHRATVERIETERNPGYCGQGIDLRISLNGVGASISIDDLHGGYHSIISWYNAKYPSRHFLSRFNCAVGDLHQYRPHHKATSCPSGWYSLAMFLDSGLCLAASGDALTPYGL